MQRKTIKVCQVQNSQHEKPYHNSRYVPTLFDICFLYQKWSAQGNQFANHYAFRWILRCEGRILRVIG